MLLFASCHKVHHVSRVTIWWRRRPRRDDEVDGVDYVFVSRQVFSGWVAQGAMLEHAIVYGDYKVCAVGAWQVAPWPTLLATCAHHGDGSGDFPICMGKPQPPTFRTSLHCT